MQSAPNGEADGGYTHNPEFGLDAARAGRLEFSPSLIRSPMATSERTAGRNDTKSSQSVPR